MLRLPFIFSLLSIALVLNSPIAVSAQETDFSKVDPKYQEKFREAVMAYEQQKFDAALKALDEAGEILPAFSETDNLRGGIYTQMRQYEKAKESFGKALEKNPKSYPVRFNLAEVEFLEKQYPKSRASFLKLREDLRADKSVAAKNMGDLDKLVSYKIVLTYILDKKDAEAKKEINQFSFMDSVPAYYFSNAALAFSQGKQEEALDFLGSADRNFRPELNRIYADSFYEVGWLKRINPTQAEPAAKATDSKP